MKGCRCGFHVSARSFCFNQATVVKYRQGDQPIQGYQLIRVIGRGGFGVVWLADGPGGVRVALKIIDLTIGRGQKELRAIGRVKSIVHPNLVPIQGLWLTDHQGQVLDEDQRESVESSLKTKVISNDRETVTDDGPSALDDGPDELIIAMGLCEKSLLDRLAECHQDGMAGIPADELIRYMEDAARGIDYLNSKTHDLGVGDVGIQHGDIKPGNLMIVGGAVQVCDFGLARVLRNSKATTIAYTPAYAAPETITSNQPSVATDQYSLAVSYLELRCGKLPFDSESAYLVAKIHSEGQLDLSALPEAERAVITKAVSLNPDDRYRSATDMVAALREAALRSDNVLPTSESPYPHEVLTEIDPPTGTDWGDSPTKAEPATTVTAVGAMQPSSGKQPRRRFGIYAGAGLILFGGIALGFYFSGPPQRPPPANPLPKPSPGSPHNADDLHQQFVALKDILELNKDYPNITQELNDRFDHLDLSDFVGLTKMQRADFNETKEFLAFLDDPQTNTHQVEAHAGERISGMVRDILQEVQGLVPDSDQDDGDANAGDE